MELERDGQQPFPLKSSWNKSFTRISVAMNRRQLSSRLHRMADESVIVTLPDLLLEHTVSCVDGRKKEEVVGAPGGNAGLFLLMLAALEQFVDEQLNEGRIGEIFESYLDVFGRFYMHTDRLALRQVHSRLEQGGWSAAADGAGSDTETGPKLPPDTVSLSAEWLRRPPEEIREDLLEILVLSEAVGCGHIRLMLEHPDDYRIRAGLVRDVLQLFYRKLWEGDERLLLDVLEGMHDEKAVVRVHVGRSAANGAEVVLAPPSSHDTDVFIYHPEAVAYLQVENAGFLVDVGLLAAEQMEVFIELQHAMGSDQLQSTLRRLAPDLPICDAVFDVNGANVICTKATATT